MGTLEARVQNIAEQVKRLAETAEATETRFQRNFDKIGEIFGVSPQGLSIKDILMTLYNLRQDMEKLQKGINILAIKKWL